MGAKRRLLPALREAAAGRAVTAQDILAALPAAMRDRLFHEGRYAVYAYPSSAISDRASRARFVADLQAVSPTATGFPITHWESIQAIERGFEQASLYAILAVLLLLLFDFRHLGRVLLSLIPLAMGGVWAWGGMALLGLQYNPASIIAFPLIIGIGVDAGVHIIHRHLQEGGRNIPKVLRTTGRAIFMSTATTMVGFGSLALAHHRGMASLGLVLLMGVSACLVTAVFVLPGLLELLRWRQALARRRGDE